VAEVLTIEPDDVQAVIGDTDSFEVDAAPGGSKITNMSGHAVVAAAEEMRQKLKSAAASLLDCSADEVKLDQGRFSAIHGSKRTVSFSDVASHAAKENGDIFVIKNYKVKVRSPDSAFVDQVAEVEVDEKTGVLNVRRIVTAHDVGTIINPLTHQGQIEGGVIQGLGYATMEEIVADNGKVVTLNLGDYRIPCVKDIPELKTVLVRNSFGPGPFAAKHIGENGIVATAAAIANALHDAVGVRIFNLPLAAEKIYFALKSSG
jgi:xanthine dehydrogenase molybdenum-binding subunit